MALRCIKTLIYWLLKFTFLHTGPSSSSSSFSFPHLLYLLFLFLPPYVTSICLLSFSTRKRSWSKSKQPSTDFIISRSYNRFGRRHAHTQVQQKRKQLIFNPGAHMRSDPMELSCSHENRRLTGQCIECKTWVAFVHILKRGRDPSSSLDILRGNI